jgi:hypothetical protein
LRDLALILQVRSFAGFLVSRILGQGLEFSLQTPLDNCDPAGATRFIVELRQPPTLNGDAPHPVTAVAEALVPVDPLQHPGWDALLSSREDCSFFQSSAWARVLHDTYGHRPLYLCRISNSRLEALLPLMEVSSWCTGKRGVSLPFTDIVPVFKSVPSDDELYKAAIALGVTRGWRYLECRNNPGDWPGAQPSLSFYGHVIPLERNPDLLFKGFASSLRRGIRKAQDEGLVVEFDSRPEASRIFYALHCRTRRKHGVPPQPVRFFDNIGKHVLGAGHGFVAIARFQQRPIAASVFFRQGLQAIYKFGASDYRYQHLRPNNLLMWEAVKRCAGEGCSSLHLGRTSVANEGLRRFKLSFGAKEQKMEYAKYDLKTRSFMQDVDRAEGSINNLFRCFPAPLFRLAGQLLYPHLS